MASLSRDTNVRYVVYAVSGSGGLCDSGARIVGAAMPLEFHAGEIVLALLNSVIARRETSVSKNPHTTFLDFEAAIDIAYGRGEFVSLLTSIRLRLKAWKKLHAHTVVLATDSTQRGTLRDPWTGCATGEGV